MSGTYVIIGVVVIILVALLKLLLRPAPSRSGHTHRSETNAEPDTDKAPAPPSSSKKDNNVSRINWPKWIAVFSLLAGGMLLFWRLSVSLEESAMEQIAEERDHPKPVRIRGSGGLDVLIDRQRNTIAFNGGAPLPILERTDKDVTFKKGPEGKYSLRFSERIMPDGYIKITPGVRIVFHGCSVEEARQLRESAEIDMMNTIGVGREHLCRGIETDEFYLPNGKKQVNTSGDRNLCFKICGGHDRFQPF